ncbi:fumarylacetoacetate hydrolase family protein [Umezawaea sp.]|uniref:fumarylacetoacetate hydrolase family protein n=1 Tax=Umezawaea sp. TaxID=1955258 RepID=UPI002ED573D1
MAEEQPIPTTGPMITVEIAVVLAEDAADPDLAVAVAHVSPALVVSDGSRVDGDASGELLVLGFARIPLDAFAPAVAWMVMTRGGEVVAQRSGPECLGDPVEALRRYAKSTTAPLVKGQVVLTGALGPAAPVSEGDLVMAHISGLGTVSAMLQASTK